MSQFFLGAQNTGPLPPIVPTSFVTDMGTVIPNMNVVNVNGAPGIFVSANPNNSNNMVITVEAGQNLTLTGDSGGPISPSLGNWNILGQKASTVPVFDTIGSGSTLSLENRTWFTQYVVDPSSTPGLRGTFTTIQSAINQAVTDGFVNPTVYIRPGTYTENLTLANGVNLKALVYNSNAGTSTNPVTINGQFINAGNAVTAFFEGIQFVGSFNVDGFVLTGSNNVFLNFTFCSLLTNASTFNCFNCTAPGSANFINCIMDKMTINNAGFTTTTNNCSFFGASSANVHALTNGSWTDIGSNGIYSITMANSSTINFANTIFGGNIANITGSSASASNYLTNCSFNNRTTKAITATGSFIVSGATNYASLGSGFYNSSPTILSSCSQQGNVLASNIQTGASYTVTLNDSYVGINHAGSVAVTLPTTNTPIDRVFVIKDQSGAAATNNITVTPASGTIDGAANFVINVNYGAIGVKFDGTNYFLLTEITSGAGGVTSVSGTLNRITSTGGTTPVIDISAAYVGQASITTLGTITTGTWNGTTIAVANGGTGLTTLTAHDVLVGAGTSNVTLVAPPATSGIPLVSNGAAADPSFTTAVVAGGGTGQTTLTNHGVLVGAGTSPITQLAVGTMGQVLIGSAGGDPAFGALGVNSGLTNHGVLLGQNNSAIVATAAGTTGQVLTGVTGSNPIFSSPVTASNGQFAVNTTITNATGDGTQYTILYDTTRFQNGSDISYNSGTGVFTVNTTGVYAFYWLVSVENLISSHNAFAAHLYFGGSGGITLYGNPFAMSNQTTNGNIVNYSGSIIMSMTASSTFYAEVQVGQFGTKTVSITGNDGAGYFTDNNFLCYNRLA